MIDIQKLESNLFKIIKSLLNHLYNKIYFLIFTSHILLCNLLTTILRPNFDEPLDTAKQMVEQNITVYVRPEGHIWKQFLQKSSIPKYNILGENMIVPDNFDHYDNISKYEVIGAGTHALMYPYLYANQLAMGIWYRSKEKLPGKNPYGGFLTMKKWHLNEVRSIWTMIC